jgi:hypothetical protein
MVAILGKLRETQDGLSLLACAGTGWGAAVKGIEGSRKRWRLKGEHYLPNGP